MITNQTAHRTSCANCGLADDVGAALGNHPDQPFLLENVDRAAHRADSQARIAGQVGQRRVAAR